jgi:hypothetical protein
MHASFHVSKSDYPVIWPYILGSPQITRRVANAGHNRPPDAKFELAGVPQVELRTLSRGQIYSNRTAYCEQHYMLVSLRRTCLASPPTADSPREYFVL